jgi:hypothetical protein
MNNKSFIAAMTALFALFILHGIARSQTIINTGNELTQNKRAMESILSRPIMEDMLKLGAQQDRELNIQSNCKSKYNIKPLEVLIYKPIEFLDNKQYPSKGIWKIRYQFDRCGESIVYSTLFTANSNGDAPKSTYFYPGSSNATPLLLKDTMPSAVQNANFQLGDKNCKECFIFDMRVTEPAHNVAEGGKMFIGVWKEVWTFRVCGKMIDVEMTFIPDANGGGTSFAAGPVKK